MKRNMLINMIIGASLCVGTMAIGGTIYVDRDASGGDTGADWSNAYTNLQDGLSAVSSGDEIWVAQGTYYPGTTRADTFQLISGVALYGGFISGDAFGDRDWENNETILSGDIGTQGVLTDNSYHIITSITNININGFTIRDGNANGTAPDDQGGGFTHTENYAGSSKIIENCIFIDNCATNRGGAIFIDDSDANETINNCTFRGNYAYEHGGAIYRRDPNDYYTNFRISDCTFIENSTVSDQYSHGYGGAIFLYHAWPKITNCIFAANSAGRGGAIGTGNINYRPYTGHGFFNCTFSGNYGHYEGGGIDTAGGTVPVKGCVFMGNYAHEGGGLQYNGNSLYDGGYIPVTGSIFAGNKSGHNGAGIDIYSTINTAIVANCIFVQNEEPAGSSTYGGGGIALRGYSKSANAIIKNTIFRDNISLRGESIYTFNTATALVSYCSVVWDSANMGTYSSSSSYASLITNLVGNIAGDPLFGAGYTGTWTGNGIYDADTGQTTLTNSSASWTENELVGMGLNPDTSHYRQLYIASNSAKSIQVWGDATDGISGDSYKVYDFRLQSGEGRWVSGTASWVKDSKFSPCIDTGDPSDDYSLEPDPNGDRINMGAFGGKATASKTKVIRGTVILIK